MKGKGQSETELRAHVRRVVAAIAPIKEVAVEPGSRFIEDLGYDSLGIVELVLTLEQELGLPEFGEAPGMEIEIELVADLEKVVVAALSETEGLVSQ